MSLTDLQRLVPVPPPGSINTGMSPCPTHFLVGKYGLPANPLPSEPRGVDAITNQFWRSRMVTEDVGPFRVTGHRLAVALLRKALADVKGRDPALYAALGSAGMLAVRAVRIRGKSIKGLPSNHSLGLAVDIKILGNLDVQGDGKVMCGLLALYGILKRHGFYWGAEFSTEDAPHFEVCAETVMGWIAEGVF